MKIKRDSVFIGVLKVPCIPVTSFKIFSLLFFFIFSFQIKAQLIINEVSQGASGSKEYVELLVIGTPTCATVPCVDLRGYIVDDNNGTFATGAGTGIANGCVKFTNDALWSCVPAGTLILIYNDADLNPLVPAQDLSLTDGNCLLVIPISNCVLFEKHATQPTIGTSTYPAAGFSACGNWTEISMANAGDSFQTRDATGTLLHAVSWGNNTLSNIIYFATGTTGDVCLMANSVDNNPSNQANWIKATVAGNETPGAANNAANAAWINSMNNNCNTITPLSTPVAFINTGCSCTGSATVTASGAVAPYTYSWTPGGSTTAVASNLCAGNYTCTVSSANGCVNTVTVAINSVSTFTTSVLSSNVTCNGANTGTSTVTPSGGSGVITYTWFPSGGNNAIASGLGAGNYTVTATDGSGCVSTQSLLITQPAVLSTTATTNNADCNGASTGSATVVASGGTAGYTYAWSPSGGNTNTASGLSAGNYNVVITDANNCTTTQTVTIAQPAILNATITVSNASCNGSSTGSATVAASGGTAGYTYTWSPSGGNATTANNLSAGNYTVNITDSKGCALTQAVSVTQPGILTATANVTANVNCNGGTTGSATVAASGGTAGYSYTWLPSGGNTASANNLSAGNYTVNITDANNCTTMQTVSITQPAILTATANIISNVTCNGASTGSAAATASGGTAGYSYTWSPSGGNTATANNLSAGNYTVNITDANNCTTTQTVSITQPAILTTNVTGTNVSCNGSNNGSALANVTGGTAAYTYSWSPSGGTTSNATGLSAGTYTVKVTDANNCQSSQSVIITQPAALAVTVITTSTSCLGNNGTASATVNGGTGAYTYTWSPSGGNTANANALSGGTYTVNITDANGCTTNTTAVVTQPVSFSVSVTTTSVSCNGGADGTASAVVTGGAGPFTYSWSPSGGTTNNAIGLSAGNYAVAVTDPNGCSSTTTAAIIQPAVLSTNVTGINVLCNGGNTGSATATVTGGTGAYTYTWSPTGGNTSTATSLTAGSYTVNVTDANGCVVTSSQIITEPSALAVNTATTAVTCNGGNNGSATAIVTGGTSPYTYSWIPSGATTSIVNNLVAGSYTVNITDANGCLDAATAVISQPALLNIIITNNPANCGLSNGTATAVVTGGITPYTYQWYPLGGTTSNAINLPAGGYTLVVTDANNCFGSGVTTITNSGMVNISVASTNVSCNGGNDGTATAAANGGTAPYNYSWSSGAATANATTLSTGNYTVTVTDNAGCMQTATVTINQPALVSVVTSGTTICNGQTATLSANASGGNAPYTYSWNSSAPQTSNTTTVSPASVSVYTVTAFDNNGCASSGVTATINVLPPLQITTGDATMCAGNNATLNASASGGNGNYVYTWMPGNLNGSSVSVSPQNTTIYTVSISDGCTATNATDTGLVNVIVVPVLTLPPNISGCAPQCMNFSVATNTNVVSWQWNFGNNASSSFQNPTYCYVTPGSYNVSLTYTTSQGCVNTVSKNNMVTVYPQPQAAFSASAFETDIYNMNISFYNQSTGSSSWQWNFGDAGTSAVQNPNHTYIDIGNYAVTLVVANQYGCKDSIAHEIIIHDDYTFYAPNAFSPNFDGVNDIFLPEGTAWDLSSYNLWVFDRWGNQVYHSEDANKGWNGTYKSNDIVQQDIYVWKVMLNDIFGKSHEYTGTVSVIK